MSKVFTINDKAKMYKEERAINRQFKMLNRGWCLINEDDHFHRRDFVINSIVEPNEYFIES